jgi:ketosteroid isomerase-like protein
MSAETTLARHLQAIETRNVDTILADYADDAVLITEHVTVRGREQLRSFFTRALQIFTPEVWSQFQILRQDVAGDVAYMAFTIGPAIPLGTDTFVVRDNKIVVHTSAVHTA